MRILVVSDIHSNLIALEAVLKAAGNVDEVWCMGDIVGYGPNPNECVEKMRSLPNAVCLPGNHDVALMDLMPFTIFNREAARSLEWQKEQITEENLDFLRSLPQVMQTYGDFTLTHGSPRDPIWEYIINTLVARLNFDAFDTAYCIVGHSHLQGMFVLESLNKRVNMIMSRPDTEIKLRDRMILNPGSVGQPRDRDPRAAYAILDLEKRIWMPKRVEYDFATVQERIRAAGLPEKHAARLSEGW
jgi:predicted phosphodiesterase